jgi:hypothetical protein
MVASPRAFFCIVGTKMKKSQEWGQCAEKGEDDGRSGRQK